MSSKRTGAITRSITNDLARSTVPTKVALSVGVFVLMTTVSILLWLTSTTAALQNQISEVDKRQSKLRVQHDVLAEDVKELASTQNQVLQAIQENTTTLTTMSADVRHIVADVGELKAALKRSAESE